MTFQGSSWPMPDHRPAPPWLAIVGTKGNNSTAAPTIAPPVSTRPRARPEPIASPTTATSATASTTPGAKDMPTAIVTARPTVNRHRPSLGSAPANAASTRSTSAGMTASTNSSAMRPSDTDHSISAERL